MIPPRVQVYAKMDEDGRFHLCEPREDRPRLAQYAGKRVLVTVEPERSKRSLSQNAYLWGVVYRTLEDETGVYPDNLHHAFKERFLPRKVLRIGRVPAEVPVSTTELDTGHFSQFIEHIRAYAATELGIHIPEPNE